MVQSGRPESSDSGAVSRRRVIWIGMSLMIWMLVILWRLAWVQVVDHQYYADLSKKDRRKKYDIEGLRGSILDRNGRTLAMSLVYKSVLIDQVVFNDIRLSPKEEREGKRAELLAIRRSRAVSNLAGLLEMSESELASKLVGTNQHLLLRRKLSPELAEQVREAISGLPGIRLIEEMERSYPNEELAAHLIGYLGVKPGVAGMVGRAGVEKNLESTLPGKPGEIALWVNARGVPFTREDTKGHSGPDIRLTIDAVLQRKVEYILRQAVDRHGAKGGGVVVMDTENGEIHALANYPTFDPNRIDTNVATGSGYVNQAVMSPYEPGSIFKVVTYAAALDQGIIRPDDIIDCGDGQITIGKRVIRDTHSYGRLTVEDAFAKSSNVGAIRIAQRLGKSTFHRYITDFGFGKQTRIELPAESPGIVHPTSRWRPDSIGSVAIGQEISVTLVQAVRAIAAIANGGFLLKPRVILEPEQSKQPKEPDAARSGPAEGGAEVPGRSRVITGETSRQMRRLMERVVTHGTGSQAVRIEGFTAAGKTGTPQKSGRSGYGAGRYMPSFAGFAPASKPRFAIVVMIDEPSDGNYYGGVVAAPVFSMVMEAALTDNDIAPDEGEFRNRLDKLVRRHRVSEQTMELSDGDEDAAGGSAVAAREAQVMALIPPAPTGTAPESGIARRWSGPGRSAASLAPPANPPATVSKASSSAPVMPNLRGEGIKVVIQTCNDLGLKLRFKGTGVVISQYPPAGAPANPGGECRLELAPR